MTCLTLCCRALNTIHEALTVAGGLFLDIHALGSMIYIVPHSLQVHYRWPGQPIFVYDFEPVSGFF